MTEEQLRARIIELEESEKNLQNKCTELENKYNELESSSNTEKEMLESRISDLKEYNKELFLKVKTEPQTQTQSQTQTKSTTSIEDVINSFN